MPTNRPRPTRLNAAVRGKKSPTAKDKATGRERGNRPRRRKDESRVLTWVAVVLTVLLIVLVALYIELPFIKAYFNPPAKRDQLKKGTETLQSPSAEDERLKRLEARAEAELKKLEERTQPPPVPPEPAKTEPVKITPEKPAPEVVKSAAPVKPPVVAKIAKPEPVKLPPVKLGPLVTRIVPPPDLPPPTSPEAKPKPAPVAPPAPVVNTKGMPARALPLDPNKLDTERIAAYQVALERMHFSCGFIDGDQGMRTQRMLRAFQTSHGLPVTGILDQATRDAIGEPGEPFFNYTVTADDLASIMPKPQTWIEKSKAPRLGYNDIWEMLAEKFHCTRAYLKTLNRDVSALDAGTVIVGPKVTPAAPIPTAASLRISLSDTSIEALDASGKIVAFFPCSIAKDKNKRPNGVLTVKVVAPNPDYTFDPALFADAAKAEGITKKMMIPPGPRNPVGTAWVGLSLPGYGIHGTPEPENISRTQSHGCFRLANWNAEKVLKMVRIGTPVDVQP